MFGRNKNYPIKVCDWLVQTGRRTWVTTQELTVYAAVGAVVVPSAFDSDLFSKVPNTDHPEFWLASVVHDFMRRSKDWTRVEADIVFGELMFNAAIEIRLSMLMVPDEDTVSLEEHTRKANKACIRLMRVSSLYLLGVSGMVGSTYIGLGKLKDRFFR